MKMVKCILLIAFVVSCSVSFAQEKKQMKKDTTQIQEDTVVVTSLPWKEEYGVPKDEWKTYDLETQKAFVEMAGFDPVKAVAEQYDRMARRVEGEDYKIESLSWKKEYGMDEDKWIKISFEKQREWLQSKGIDVDKAIKEERERLNKRKDK